MNIDWSTYKITLLLYIGVLLFPLGFYFSYSSFSEIQRDTKVLNTLNKVSSVLLLDVEITSVEKDKIRKSADEVFINLKPWMIENNSKKFYVGLEPLLQKYDSLVECWNTLKNANNSSPLLCYKKSRALIFSIENMLKLKQNRVYNIFYINLFVAMALLLTLIFLTRAYIYQQLKKNAIYDLKTNLFTKQYMVATLKELIAKASRSKEMLSAIYIDVDELKSIENNAQKDKILESIGSSLLKSLRLSDIACRYSENEFVVMLPNTSDEHFELLTTRLEKNLSALKCTIKAVQHKEKESSDDFIARVI